MSRSIRHFGVVLLILTVLLGVGAAASAAPAAQQNVDIVAPQALERLSWGAVIAGSVIALVIQFALNLLGISIGVSSINPQYGQDSAEPKSLATGAGVWVGLSTLIALFFGGWLAARFAGLPNDLDGMLHGILVWGVVMLISMILLLSGIGRVVSGMSNLIGQGLHMAGQVAQVATQGVTNVARGVAGAAQSAAQAAGSAVQDAAHDAQMAARQAGHSDVMREIQDEVRRLMQQAGVSPDRVRQTADTAVQDVKNTAQQIARNPAEAERLITEAVERIINRAQNTVSDVDRQAVIDVMVANANMTEQQARQTLARWEQMPYQAAQQAEQAKEQIEQKAEEVRWQAEQKIDQIRHDVDRTARDAAQAVTDAIARIAGIAFAAIVIGAIAAGIGGILGAPDEVPVIVEEVGQLPPQP